MSKRFRRELTVMERRQAISSVLVRSNGGKPRRGGLHEVASIFGVHKRTIARLWKRDKVNAELYGVYEAPSMKHRCGRKPHNLNAALERLRNVGPHERTTIRSAATASGVPATTLFRRLKQGKLRSCTSVTRPCLTADNMQERVKFCIDHVDMNAYTYKDMMDVIHVDEKYFYLTVMKRRFILLLDEPEPVRKLKSRRHITKVMMLAAVARPRYNAAGECIFDRKLGTWPFVEYTMLIEKLLPAISEKWPGGGQGCRIAVQQDNAPPHIDPNDPDFCAAVEGLGLNVRLRFQPPNSPDMNCCDLGIFNAIQARQQQRLVTNVAELAKAATDAYWELPDEMLNSIFLTLHLLPMMSFWYCIHSQGESSQYLHVLLVVDAAAAIFV
ncbi:hypothetical protein PHMEG_0005132 [Phytophthora megakarya]|uniref:DUF7769 domain-containing protein n=1 Tax=Phytophthora megakarya TaxID=4795 RepID=A0A225WS95_9STRA|nr:hypothetical protein PHMEG_0005132 [Phytophthora megakarya]